MKKQDPIRTLGRIFLCFCILSINEWLLFHLIAFSGIMNGNGVEGLRRLLISFIVLSFPVVYVTCYYTWKFTKND